VALEIPVPPPAAINGITAVLGSIEDKIDSNRRLARLLEETAATLFRARFVDFVGVDQFEESEIGRVPSGWPVANLSSRFELLGGGTPKTDVAEYWDGGVVPSPSSPCVSSGFIDCPRTRLSLPHEEPSETSC